MIAFNMPRNKHLNGNVGLQIYSWHQNAFYEKMY